MSDPFYRLDKSIAARRDMTPADKIVLAVIETLIGGNDHCWPSKAKLQDLTGLSDRCVLTSLLRLEKKKLLVIHRQGNGRRNLYSVKTGEKSSLVKKVHRCKKFTTTGEKSSPQPVKKVHQLPNRIKNRTNNRTASGDLPLADFISRWNETGTLPVVRKMTPDREKALRRLMEDQLFRDNWQEVINRLAASPFHTGQNERGWTATIDWLIKNDTNYLKILEQTQEETTGTREIDAEEAERLLKGLNDGSRTDATGE